MTTATSKIIYHNGEDNTYTFDCPHCDNLIQVYIHEINCQIFRHGIYKDSFEQVNPHMPKQECDRLVDEELVMGCCKPFRIFLGDEPFADICDYI